MKQVVPSIPESEIVHINCVSTEKYYLYEYLGKFGIVIQLGYRKKPYRVMAFDGITHGNYYDHPDFVGHTSLKSLIEKLAGIGNVYEFETYRELLEYVGVASPRPLKAHAEKTLGKTVIVK